MKAVSFPAKLLIELNRVFLRMERFVMVTGTLILLIIMFYQVVCRYVLYIPTPWVEEVSRYIFIWTAYAGAAYVVITNDHIVINIMDKVLAGSDRLQAMLKVITQVITIVFFVIFCYIYGNLIVQIARFNQYSPSAGINMLVPMSSGIICGVLMLIHGISRIILPDIAEHAQ